MNRRSLYFFIVGGCLLGFSWLAFSANHYQKEINVCLLKNVTGFACPSCGSTRAILMLIDGDILNSLKLNPLGILMVTIMTILPIWTLFDLLFRKSSLLYFYIRSERFIKKKSVAIPLVAFLLGNWIWNIFKGI